MENIILNGKVLSPAEGEVLKRLLMDAGLEADARKTEGASNGALSAIIDDLLAIIDA